MICSTLTAGWPGGPPAPVAPLAAGAPYAYWDQDIAAALGTACPSFPPPRPPRPLFDGPPLPFSALLSARDLDALGGRWHPLGHPHRAILPVYVAEDLDPVLPADQQSGIYTQLWSRTVTVQETVIRYAGGTGGAAARIFAAQLRCTDGWHGLAVLLRGDGFNVTTRVYSKQLLVTPRPPTSTWDAVVRSVDVVSILHVRGQLGDPGSPTVARRLVQAVLRRLQTAQQT